MKVAEQRDGIALKALGPAAQRNILPHDAGAVGLQHGGIDAEGGHAGSCRETNKRPPVDGKWGQSVWSLALSGRSMSDVQVAAYRECELSRYLTTAVHPRWISRSTRTASNNQKLNVACKSMRRFAAELENGPPCKAFETSKNGDPRIPLGFARFTLLKTFRTFTPSIRL